MLVKYCGMRCYWEIILQCQKIICFCIIHHEKRIVSQQLGFGDFALLQGSS